MTKRVTNWVNERPAQKTKLANLESMLVSRDMQH
jgi:hypothetical protein